MIASRSQPDFDLAFLRAKGRVVELSSDDLRFTGEEVVEYFKEATGLELPPETARALEERTDGWITFLQMTAISLKDQEDPATLLANLQGSSHYLSEFLAEEVLDRQPGHILHEGRLYNGYPIDKVTAHGALELGIHELREGVVSRGVLLDVPRSRGVPFLEAGEPIFPDDRERAERDARLRVEPGDLLLVRTGRWALRDARGPWDPRVSLAGLDASCLPWLHERGVAALGSDGVSDVLPSRVPDVGLPIHSVAIAALGLHLIDNLELEPLASTCVAEARWEFLLTLAPLVLLRGTASPLNPIPAESNVAVGSLQASAV